MPKSRNRKNHKQKAANHKNKLVARRAQVKRLVGELESEFAKLESPVSTVSSMGTFLTPTPEITQSYYDNLEI